MCLSCDFGNETLELLAREGKTMGIQTGTLIRILVKDALSQMPDEDLILHRKKLERILDKSLEKGKCAGTTDA